MRHLSSVTALMLSAVAQAQISLVSRYSEAHEESGDSVRMYYDNTSTFTEAGWWSGALPEGFAYSHYASELGMSGSLQARSVSWGQSRGFLYERTHSLVSARYTFSTESIIDLDFSGRSTPVGFGDTSGNANLQIVSVDTGAIVFDLFRDGEYSYDGYTAVWSLQSWSGRIAAGTYDLIAATVASRVYGGGSGLYTGSARLDFTMAFTPIPAPHALGISFATIFLTRRRRV
jgi:hypothetical protein